MCAQMDSKYRGELEHILRNNILPYLDREDELIQLLNKSKRKRKGYKSLSETVSSINYELNRMVEVRTEQLARVEEDNTKLYNLLEEIRVQRYEWISPRTRNELNDLRLERRIRRQMNNDPYRTPPRTRRRLNFYSPEYESVSDAEVSDIPSDF